jgi:hypothetical protein
VEARGVGGGSEVQLVRIDFCRRERRRGLDPIEDAEIIIIVSVRFPGTLTTEILH